MLNLQANELSPGSRSEVTLTVSAGSRSSSMSVFIVGLAAGEPVVSLQALTPQYMNSDDALKLQGTVDAMALGTAGE